MELTIDQALQQGVAAHKAGKLEEAERLYRAILQSQPTHSDANHNLGVLAVSVNKVSEALPLFKAALNANPKVEQFWFSYIDGLIKEAQFEVAKHVIAEARENGIAGDNLTVLEEQVTQAADGKAPPQAQIDKLLGFYQSGQLKDAEALAVSLTQQFPAHPFGWKVLGAILGQTGRKTEAVSANQTAIALNPQDAEAHNNLGVLFKELGRLDEAETSLRKATVLKTDFAESHYNLGITLKELKRLDEAEVSLRKAIALKPEDPVPYNDLASTLNGLGNFGKAEEIH